MSDLPEGLRAVVLYAPNPEYPSFLYNRGVRGGGTYRLIIDPKNGKVTEVNVLKHARFAILDELAAKAFLQWRFRPGTSTQETIRFEFSSSGYSSQVH